MNIYSKRVYDPAGEDDGYRVLVDRLWPRGIKKQDLGLDLWAKFLAPSPEARRMFDHRADRFEWFRACYLQELDESEEACAFAEQLKDTDITTLTLLYAARDRSCNHAMVLGEWLANRTGQTFTAG